MSPRGEPTQTEASDGAPAFPAPMFDTTRFRVLRRLGAGGFGVVYLVRDLATGADVALKTIPTARAELIYRLKREFRALADLRHENLVSFHELFAEEDRVFLTMEYVPGVDFLAHVRGTGMDEPRLRRALGQLAAGLGALHAAGKLHCDVKPSNVLVTPEGRVVLLDFGLATDIVESELGPSLELAGTPEYMAPEYLLREPLSPASDWYSVGVMLYQALTGEPPFRGSWDEIDAARARLELALSDRLASAPADLAALCGALLASDPRRRAGAQDVRSVMDPAAASASAEVMAPEDVPFIGRDPELAELEAALARVRTGEGLTVLVDGLSGAGKSALVDRYLQRSVRLSNALVLRGRCYERERVPYTGFDSLTDDLCRLLQGLDPAAGSRFLPRHMSALTQLFPIFERVRGVTGRPERSDGPQPDSQELRRQAFGALRELLARLGDQELLVLHVDDLQWGDLDTAALLAELTRPPDEPRMLLVLSFRSEDTERSRCLQLLRDQLAGSTLQVHVGPLLPAAAEALMRQLLPPSRRGEAARLAEKAEGVPFLLQEVARYVRETDTAPGTTPVELRSVVEARVARLPADARRLLEILAVAGHPVPELVAWRATGLSGTPWEGAGLLGSHHLIRSVLLGGERHLEPSHDRIRHTVTTALDPERTRDCHRGLARALGSAADTDPEVLAWHHQHAGDVELALRFTVEAASGARRVLAFDRAARLFRRAVDLTGQQDAGRPGLLVEYADALVSAGRSVEAAQAFLEAAAHGPSGSAKSLRRRAAEQLMFAGRIDQAKELLREDLRWTGFGLRRTHRGALLSLLWHRLKLRSRGLVPARAATSTTDELEFLEHVYRLAAGISFVDALTGAELAARFVLRALDSGDPALAAKGLLMAAAHAVTEAPHSASAARLAGVGEMHGAALHQPEFDADILIVRTFQAYFGGQWRTALVGADRAARIFREELPAFVWEQWTCRYLAIWALFFLGDWNEMERRVRAGVEEARERGNVYGMAGTCAPFGVTAWLRRGEVETARRTLREVTTSWSVEGMQFQHFWFLTAETLIHLYAGEARAGWQLVQSRWREIASSLTMRFPVTRMNVLYLRGCAALAAAREERAGGPAATALVAEARRAARRLEGVNLAPARPLAQVLRAGVAAHSADLEGASRQGRTALSGLQGLDMQAHAAAVSQQLARLRGDGIPAFLPGQPVADPLAVARMLAPEMLPVHAA